MTFERTWVGMGPSAAEHHPEPQPLKLMAKRDRFDNGLDDAVGYARGSILRGAQDECRRGRHAARLILARLEEGGIDSLHNLTGNQSRFPIAPDDVATLQDEAVGGAWWLHHLEDLALSHLRARAGDRAGLFNRTSAGIIASVAALTSPGDTTLSVVPGVPSHPSVRKGTALASATLLEVASLEELAACLSSTRGSLVVVTGVSSELATMAGDVFVGAIRMAQRASRLVLVDDAYGARLRTVLEGQPGAREAGADLVITSTQKAGLQGPRAGLLVGQSELVQTALTKGMEYGLEARAPITLGAVRALEHYRPDHLLDEVMTGQQLSRAFVAQFGVARVSETALGPMISEEDVLAMALERRAAPVQVPAVVPAEAAAALGMLLLTRAGILTVCALGMPGARTSLRLRSSPEEIEQLGGAQAVAGAVDACIHELASIVDRTDILRALILGDPANG